MPNLIGQSLGRYHILEQLGEGGMAVVYKAYDTRLERDVAVKVIRVDQFAPTVLERVLMRFEDEAKGMGRLTHTNIVGVIDYGEQDGIPYLVMPYISGGTLKQYLEQHSGKLMSWQEALKLLLPIAEALDYAHTQNIIHRDVKPSNILLIQSGKPMLTDFGIAKILESERTQTLTGTGMSVGTPEYMAPEQANAKAVDKRADIYSLGVVLYELVTGRKPFEADTPNAVLIMQARDPLPRPRRFASDLPEGVEKIIFKALAKRPEDRYPDMGAFVGAMESALGKGGKDKRKARFGVRSEPEHPVEPDTHDTLDRGKGLPELVKDQAPKAQKKTSRDAHHQRPRFNRLWIPVLLILGIAGLGGLGIWVNGNPAPPEPTGTPTDTQILINTPSLTITFTKVPTHTSIPSLTRALTKTPSRTLTRTPSPTQSTYELKIISRVVNQARIVIDRSFSRLGSIDTAISLNGVYTTRLYGGEKIIVNVTISGYYNSHATTTFTIIGNTICYIEIGTAYNTDGSTPVIFSCY